MKRYRVAPNRGNTWAIHDDLRNRWVVPINKRGSGAVKSKQYAEELCAAMEAEREQITLDSDLLMVLAEQMFDEGWTQALMAFQREPPKRKHMGDFLRHRVVKVAKELETRMEES